MAADVVPGDEDAAWNRRLADEFGLCVPAGVPGFPYDGGATGTGKRIDAYDERKRRRPTTEEQQAIEAAEQWADSLPPDDPDDDD
jgi:hypothetical protein